MSRIGKFFLTIAILGIVAASSSCSFIIRFDMRNLSDRAVTVSYVIKEGEGAFSPRLVTINTDKEIKEYNDLPEDRIAVDLGQRSVEFTLLPKEVVELFRITAEMDEDYAEEFRIKSLSVSDSVGSINIQGEQILKKFRPIRSSWYEFGPSIRGFVFDYQ